MAVVSNLLQAGINAFGPLFAQGSDQFGQMNEDLFNETTQTGWDRNRQLKAQAGRRPGNTEEAVVDPNAPPAQQAQPQQPQQQPGQGQYPQGYQGPRAPTTGQGMNPQAYRNPSNIPGLASMSSPGPGPPRNKQPTGQNTSQAGLDKNRRSVLTSAGRMDAVRNNVTFEFQKEMEKQTVDDPNGRQIATEKAIGTVLKRLAKDPALALEFLMVPTGGAPPAMTAQGSMGRTALEGDLRSTLKEYSSGVPGDTGEPWERQPNARGNAPDTSRFMIRPPAAEVQQELANMYNAYEETQRFGQLLSSPGVLGDQAREEQELDMLRKQAGRTGQPLYGGTFTNEAHRAQAHQRHMSGMDQAPGRGPTPESSSDRRPVGTPGPAQPGVMDSIRGIPGAISGKGQERMAPPKYPWVDATLPDAVNSLPMPSQGGGRGSYSGVRGGGGQKPDWSAMPGKARELLENAWEAITGRPPGSGANLPEQTTQRPEHESETAIDAMLAAMLTEGEPLDEEALQEESPEALAEALRQLIESSQRTKGMP